MSVDSDSGGRIGPVTNYRERLSEDDDDLVRSSVSRGKSPFAFRSPRADSDAEPRGFGSNLNFSHGADARYMMNALAGVLLFLAWVACCVTFSADFQNKHICPKTGEAVLAFTVFAFLALTMQLGLRLSVAIRKDHLPYGGDVGSLLRAELAFTAFVTICFFIVTCAWGASCYSKVQDEAEGNSTVPAYQLDVVCFMFLLCVLGLLWRMRKMSPGGGADGVGGSEYQTLADPAAAGAAAAAAAAGGGGAPHGPGGGVPPAAMPTVRESRTSTSSSAHAMPVAESSGV